MLIIGFLNGAARDVLASATYQTDAVLLTTAAIAAAGGYHMSLAALANLMMGVVSVS